MGSAEGGTHGRVVVAQPGRQHAYETAVSLQEAGLLQAFVTALYDRGRGLTSPRLISMAPGPVRRRLRGRRHPDLDERLIVTIPRYHALSFVRQRVASVVSSERLAQDEWAHERFDKAVSRRLAVWRPRAVHAFEGSALATFEAARRIGATTILDVANAHEYHLAAVRHHGDREARFAPERIRAERALADYLLAPSAFVRRCLVENGVPENRVVDCPYGTDPRPARPSRPLNDPFRVLFVGQLGARKGVATLLEAWRMLGLTGAELVLVGPADAYGRDVLRRYAGLFRWAGQASRGDVERWYASSDVFAFPTLAEGSALVSYEALAWGLPVVTTPNCGSVVRDGRDGFLVPPREVDALAARIELLYRDPELRRSFGESGRELIERNYTWAHYRERLRDVYETLLTPASTTRPEAVLA